ncbi:hypothetical protein KEM52_001067 [Ascosphaera acerosa]|nr:hypothetical protein KEM52_001067 [Ascosphaera acerosa]
MFNLLRQLGIMASEGPATKRAKLSGPLIGTHSGQFHADEALAVYLLRKLPQYTASPVVRTRDPAVLATCHTVVDVGGEYDSKSNRFDHHQRTFATTFPGHETRLSSAGLVYMHLGKQIIADYMRTAAGRTVADMDADADVQLVYRKLYKVFIEAIDANDNGVTAYDNDALAAAGIEKRFSDNGVTAPAIVRDMNQPNPDAPASEAQDDDALFAKASTFMGETFDRKLRWAVRSWLPARAVMQKAYAARRDVHPSGRIIALPEGGVPWKEHLYNLEEEDAASTAGKGESDAGAETDAGSAPATTDEAETKKKEKKPYDPRAAAASEVFFVLFPESSTDPASKWRVQAASTPASAFESRLPLKESWRGVRDEALDGVMAQEAKEAGKDGVPPGAVFVHASGFIGGHKTREGALAMAVKTLEALGESESA